MAYLTSAELASHLYNEIVAEISRADDTLMTTAIDAAIAEATGYLNKYDVAAVFDAEGADRNQILLLYVKDISVWHFINLANPNVEMELRLTRYEKAIDWLRGVQSGKITPDLPYPTVDPENDQSNNQVRWGSARTRQKGYL